MQDWKSRFAQNWGIIPGTTTPVPLDMDSLEVGACGDSTAAKLGRRCDIYRDGRHQESELAVSGGTGNLNYYLSGNLLDSQGADPNNDLRRYSTRMNLGLAATQTFRISANLGLNTGPTQLGCEGGCGGHTWTTLLGTPANYNNPRRHGFHSLLPYQYDDIYHYWQNLDRFSGSLRFDHTPFTWFQQHLSIGLDRTREENDTYAPRIDSLVYTVGSDALGYRSVQDRSTTYNTIDYSAQRDLRRQADVALDHVGRRAVLPQLRRLRLGQRFRLPDAGSEHRPGDDAVEDERPGLPEKTRRSASTCRSSSAGAIVSSSRPRCARTTRARSALASTA